MYSNKFTLMRKSKEIKFNVVFESTILKVLNIGAYKYWLAIAIFLKSI